MKKRLTDYITGLGRVVAFYPGLKQITGSTTATIMLCQFLYWSDKTTDGWIYKTTERIEYETGLTYNEQKTAKNALVELGLLEVNRRRIDRDTGYRVNQEILNTLWEEKTGNKSELIKITIKSTPVEIPAGELPDEEKKFPQANPEPLDDLAAEMLKEAQEKGLSITKEPIKKGDLLDGMLDAQNSAGMKKMQGMIEIRKKIEKRLHINTDNRKWEGFIEFVYGREKVGEPVDTFLEYALREGFNPIYWTPEKMKTLYPQAFVDDGKNKPREDFIAPLPPRKEEKYAPMPKDIGKEHKLY